LVNTFELVSLFACYSAALALEASRLVLRLRLRRVVTYILTASGLVAHTMLLLDRTLASETPLSSFFDWYMLAAWVVAATYLYLAIAHTESPIGLFVLPLVLSLVAVAVFFADRNAVAESEARSIWGTVHAAFLLVGTVAVTIGFAAGLMYLVASYRLKHKLPPTRGFQLPSLEWLERLNARALLASVPLLAGGLVSALILNLVMQRLSWNDPLIWILTTAVAWLSATALFNIVYRPARQGRKVAYLTVSNFLVLVVCLGTTLFVDTDHSGEKSENEAKRPPAALFERVRRPYFYMEAKASRRLFSSDRSRPFVRNVMVHGVGAQFAGESGGQAHFSADASRAAQRITGRKMSQTPPTERPLRERRAGGVG
jgi:ABC-type uncharacterized transport system permease subunit